MRFWRRQAETPTISNPQAQTETPTLDEAVDIVRAGADYFDLTSRPGWKRLVDDLEARADRALKAMRLCESEDPAIIKGYFLKWREAEDSLDFVQINARDAIAHRQQVIREMGQEMAGLDLDLTSIEDQKIVEFMKGGGRSTAEAEPQYQQPGSGFFSADE